MKRVDTRARLAGSLLVLALAAACGSTKEDTGKVVVPPPERPQILTFGASPDQILAGEEVTLAWTTRNVVAIALADDAGNPVAVDPLALEAGSVTVSPTTTTDYTFTATGAGETPATAYRTVRITVRDADPEPPAIEEFTASAEQVPVGGEVTLSWRTSHATALTLKDDAGVAIDLGSAAVAAGSVVVRPARSPTTYSLVATGGGRRVTAQVAVDVVGLPRVHRFFVEPIAPVAAGDSVTLSWETSRASRVVITDDAGTVHVDSTTELAGNLQLALGRTTTFELTATGEGGEASATAMAQVGATIDAFSATPRVARADDPITLTWQTTGAESVSLTGPGGYLLEVPAAQVAAGSVVVPLPASGDYVLAARLGTVVQTWAIYVEVTEAPRVRALSSNVAVVTAAADHPEVVTLSYEQDGGTSCILFRNGEVVPEYDGFPCLPTGTLDVQLTGPSDLRLVAVNHAGDHDASVRVGAVPPARIPAFTKDPARRLAPGASVQLAWQVTDAVGVRLERAGVDLGLGATEFVGTRTETVTDETPFRLVALNSLGHETVARVTVFAGAPLIEEFVAASDVVAPGENITLSWRCDGGDALLVLDQAGGEAASVTDHAAIDAGSVTVVAADLPGSYRFTLRVANGAGQQTEATVDVIVTDGPLVRSFTASRAAISLGSSVDLTWIVSNDLAGVTPTLALADDHGNSYPLTGLDPNADTVTVTPEQQGTYVFTLTASTPGTMPSERSVTVDVVVAPSIASFTATPDEVYTQGGTPTVTLAWQTANGIELTLREADAAGNAIPGTTFHHLSLAAGASQAELDGGSLAIQPQRTTRYLLQVANALGNSVSAVVTVKVDPPSIVSFVADPPDVIAGEATNLTWDTENAVTVAVKPLEPAVTQVSNGFVDISALAGVQPLSLATNDSWELVDFPQGFRFPFDGKLHEGMRVTSNGYVSFDVAGTAASNSNATFPTSTALSYVHLAPFWDYLKGDTGTAAWRYDAVARTVTVMWKNWSYRTTSTTCDMNLELVLHENGNFAFHYGRMFCGLSSSGSTDYQYYADGAYATIGFQDLTASSGRTMHHGSTSSAVFPGGLSNRGWHFDLAMPLDGSKPFVPESNRTYTLVATGKDLVETATAEVRVWAQPQIVMASVSPSGPEAGVPFYVNWRNVNATRVRVYDTQQNLLCEESDPALAAQGRCSLTLASSGSQSVTLEVINGLERNVATRTVNFVVFPRLDLEFFTASHEFVASGAQVTLTWQGIGGFEAELWACVPKTDHGQCTPVDLTGKDPNHDTYTTTLTQSTEFWFRLIDRLTRSDEASANVWVDAPTFDSWNVSATQVPAGGSVTIDWATTGAGVATTTGLPLGPPTELTGSAPFLDISTSGTPVPLSGTAATGYYTFNFPAGFTFEYFGTVYTGMQATTEGWATFDTSNSTNNPTDQVMPSSSTYNEVHFAPFWDSMSQKSTGGVRYELRTDPVAGRFLIVQWTGFEFSSSTYNPSNLNFQMLLYETGFVEYRYGLMESTNATPANREAAQGRYATIGLQSPDVSFGQMVLRQQTAVPALPGRAWRFNLRSPPDGTSTVTPTESTTYRVCVTNASLYDACREVRVVVVRPGDLMISELMVAPANSEAEWFELRNLAVDPIDLAGMRLVSGAETFDVPAMPALPLAPNAFAILSRSGDPGVNGGLAPRVVYGNTLDLGDTADGLEVRLGTLLVDEVTWDAAWPIAPGRTVMLEPSRFNRAEDANDAVAGWCSATAVYGGGLGGNPGAVGPGCRSDGGYAYYVLDPYAGAPFIDISQTGTEITGLFTSPYTSATIPLGFSFPYFDGVATEMQLTKLGYLALAPITGTPSTSNTEIPNATTLPNGIVAPMWDNFYEKTARPPSIAYELRVIGGHLVMIAQWTDLSPNSSSSDYGYDTLQAQLWDNGDIVFAYRVKPPDSPTSTTTYCYGSAATVGLESIDGLRAIQIFHGTSSTGGGPIYDGRSYRFTRK